MFFRVKILYSALQECCIPHIGIIILHTPHPALHLSDSHLQGFAYDCLLSITCIVSLLCRVEG